ncbi:hypothetical protein FOA52_012416 [Chlamydomonas sp. UWO 241]|nr:hypothetical protein FOA52_012416 [Chlamydomonas sp. UWO 241]
MSDPTSRKELAKLVKKLGATAQPGQRQQAIMEMIQLLATAAAENKDDVHAAIAEAGAIPPLVQMLGPRTPVVMQLLAVAILGLLLGGADATDIAVTMAAAGAIPPLLDAAIVLNCLAEYADGAITIAAVGAIPPLVKLLGPDSPDAVQEQAAALLGRLAENDDITADIVAAGAMTRQVQLMGSGSGEETKAAAAGALGAVLTAVARIVAPATVDLLHEMQGLGL